MFKLVKLPTNVKQTTGEPSPVPKLEGGKSEIYKNIIAAFVIILLGVTSGYFLSQLSGLKSSSIEGIKGVGEESKIIVGSQDTKTFKDSTEGELQAGGINGEGTHRLIRSGGESQTVYLTSSVLDLSQFEGKKVRVWGETFAAQQAGWLMDVGKIEVIE